MQGIGKRKQGRYNEDNIKSNVFFFSAISTFGMPCKFLMIDIIYWVKEIAVNRTLVRW